MMTSKQNLDELRVILATSGHLNDFEKQLLASIEAELNEGEKQKKILDILKGSLVLELDENALSVKQYQGQSEDYTIISLDSNEECQLLAEWLSK